MQRRKARRQQPKSQGEDPPPNSLALPNFSSGRQEAPRLLPLAFLGATSPSLAQAGAGSLAGTHGRTRASQLLHGFDCRCLNGD